MNEQQYNPYSPYLANHQVQPSRGDEILKTLMQLFQQPQAGDGFNFNRPQAPQINIPQPNMDFMRMFAQQSVPRRVVDNRIY